MEEFLMTRAKFIFFAFSFFMAFSTGARADSAVSILKATGELSTVEGKVVLKDTPEGLYLRADVSGATPGDHGFHIHQYGNCGDVGNAAGDHYNPAHASHGNVLKDGVLQAHTGDLGNLTVGEDGKGTLEATIPGVQLSGGKYSVGGRAMVLHEKKDDFGQPTGNAGARVACGGIFLSAE
jgi:Cu-Zn family superoxide dismutase